MFIVALQMVTVMITVLSVILFPSQLFSSSSKEVLINRQCSYHDNHHEHCHHHHLYGVCMYPKWQRDGQSVWGCGRRHKCNSQNHPFRFEPGTDVPWWSSWWWSKTLFWWFSSLVIIVVMIDMMTWKKQKNASFAGEGCKKFIIHFHQTPPSTSLKLAYFSWENFQ